MYAISGHLEYEPGQLSAGPVRPVVVAQLGQDENDEYGEEGAEQLQQELLALAVRLGRAEHLLVQVVNLRIIGEQEKVYAASSDDKLS